MANDGNDDDFGKELAAAFDATETPAETKPTETPKADDTTPPAPETPPKPGEEPKPDEAATPEVPKEGAPATPPADPTKTPEGDPAASKTPEAPATPPEPPKPITLDDIKGVINEVRTEERTTGQALENTTKEVLDAYYPSGLSNVLTTPEGKELKSPQDVVDASGGEMTTEEAAQWLMNEQFKLDQNVAKIKEDAKGIAETTLKFKQDSIDVLTRYDALFKKYPNLQQKVWNSYQPLIKADEAKGVILSAPDMRQYYDTMLEPYRLAFEFGEQQPATAATPPAPGAPAAAPTPPAPTPGVNDRLDEGGDGGTSPVDDPNDFAQQVNKELSRGM